VQRIGWGSWETTDAIVAAHDWWWIVLVPAVGGLIVGPLVYFLAREAKGHGVPEVMEAVALRQGVIRPRLVIVKSLASAITIGTGGSVGREGPIVQIGSAIGSTIGQILKVSGARLRTLVGCGAAAGIAATFNAPVAGALFAVEIILGDFGVSQFSPIVIASVTATVISRAYLGNIPAFVIPQHTLNHPGELFVYMILGVAAALVATAFIKTLYGLEDLADRLPIKSRLKPWILAPLGLAMIGGVGVFFPQVFGVGYEAIEAALRGEMALGLLTTLLLIKILATSVTIAAGGSGGVFAPSLFLGAMTGGLIGVAAERLFPGSTASSGAYALVGMGAVVAAATQAPITAILIIFELTSDYKLILPLMASCIIATLAAEKLSKQSIYTMKLSRRGVNIREGREINVLRSLHVRDEMTQDLARVGRGETFGGLLTQFTDSPHAHVYVTGDQGELVGVIDMRDLSSSIPDAHVLSNLVLAGDLAHSDLPTVTPELNLDTVMRMFDGRAREELPVIDGASKQLVGVISRQHLIDGYNRELMKRDMVSGMSGGLEATSRTGGAVRLGEGTELTEIDAPGEFLGHTIHELDVRKRFDVQVLLVRRRDTKAGTISEVAPSADFRVERGDRLVVMGTADHIRRMRAL